MEEDNCNEETRDQNPGEKDVGQEGDVPKKVDRGGYYNENDLQVWKDRCLWRDGEMKGMANKLADLQSVVNFMMQNNIIQPPFLLQDTLISVAKNDAQDANFSSQERCPECPPAHQDQGTLSPAFKGGWARRVNEGRFSEDTSYQRS
ncbi:hypothetical protein ACSBR2_033826 [Camellia fascicularis]